MKKLVKLCSGNIWKILFVLSTAILLFHLISDRNKNNFSSSSYEKGERISKEAPNVTSRETILKTNEILQQLTSLSSEAKSIPPITGILNNRPFTIYNNTPPNPETMISNLNKFRQTNLAKRNQIIEDFGGKKLEKLRFLHIPKAGKAFSITMMHYCCQLLDDLEIDISLPQNYQIWRFDPSCRQCMMQPVTSNGDYFAHYPYFVGTEIDTNQVILLLREPFGRLAYQIDQMRGLRGMMTLYGFDQSAADVLSLILAGQLSTAYESIFQTKNLQNINFNQFQSTYSNSFLSKAKECLSVAIDKNRTVSQLDACRFQLTAFYPGVSGCQTKLILGIPCAEDIVIKKEEMVRAKKTLRDEILFAGKNKGYSQSI
jgi:hypothetical protein